MNNLKSKIVHFFGNILLLLKNVPFCEFENTGICVCPIKVTLLEEMFF